MFDQNMNLNYKITTVKNTSIGVNKKQLPPSRH